MSNKILSGVQLIQKAILIKDGQVLALKRTLGDDCRANRWDLPGGRYEEGEEVIAAIKREIKEEANLKSHLLSPLYFACGLDSPNQLMRGNTVFALCYLCLDWEGEVGLSNEHTEFKWVTPSEFLKLDFGDDGGFFVASMQAYLNH